MVDRALDSAFDVGKPINTSIRDGGLKQQTGVVCVSHRTTPNISLDSSQNKVDVQDEDEGAENGTLWRTNNQLPRVRTETPHPHHLRSSIQIRPEPGNSDLRAAYVTEHREEMRVVKAVKRFGQVKKSR